MEITGVHNIEIGHRARNDVRRLYEDTLRLPGLPGRCPEGNFSVQVGPQGSPLAGILTFSGSGEAIRAVTLAVAKGSLLAWRARLLERGARVVGRAVQFGEEYLCFEDDAEFDLALVEAEVDGEPRASNGEIVGIRNVEIDGGLGNELQSLFEAAGMTRGPQDGPIVRYQLAGRPPSFVIDIFRSARISFRTEAEHRAPQRLNFSVSDRDALRSIKERLRASGFEPKAICGRDGAVAVRLLSLPSLEVGFVCREEAGGAALRA